MNSSKRRFTSDADLEDVDGGLLRDAGAAAQAPRARATRPSPANRGAKSGSSSWFGAPLVFGALTIFALMVLAQVYQFSGVDGFPPLRTPFSNETMVEFTTKFGKFTIQLYPEHAPRTVEMFRKLVDSGFYTTEAGFYHNEPKYVLQGGGFLYDKPSPFGQLPVEYSLPSTERMVVMARGKKSDSGSTEFAIMLHDNTVSNQPTEDDPGYTVFGRIASGWHTIEQTSKKMNIGFMSKEDRERQVAFESVGFVNRVSHGWPEVQKRLEHFRYVLETPHTVIIISELDCPEKKELETIFRKLRSSVRTAEIGHALHLPYEFEAIEALTGVERSALPAVFIEGKYIGGLKEVQKLQRMGQLHPTLEKSGVLAEDTVWTAINQHPLVLFSKSFCPYCKKTKETLAALGANPYVFELDLREDGKAIQNFLFRLTHQSTVPNVFIKAKSIGGNDDTQDMYLSGELEERLRRAGAIS